MLSDRAAFYKIQSELKRLCVTASTPPLASEEIIGEACAGSIKYFDAFVLKQLLQRYKPSTILEVGSFLGFSSRWLLESSSPWNAKVTAVDPNIPHRIFQEPMVIAKKFNAKFVGNGRLEIVEAFFGKLIMSPYYYRVYAVAKLAYTQSAMDNILNSKPIFDEKSGRKFDFIFIDGNHAYENVKSNFQTALKLLNNNGHIVFHDAWSFPDVKKILEEINVLYGEKAKVRIHYHWIRNNVFREVSRHFRFLRFLNSDGIGEFYLVS